MTGYVNGNDLLVGITSGTSTKTVGHCTTHTATYTTETKDVAVKPLATVAAAAASYYKEKRITGLAVQVKADGIKFYSETEGGFKELLGKWVLGQTVTLKLFERSHDSTPYCTGNFVITSLEETNPAGEDATYSATFDSSGAVTIDTAKIDLLAGSGSGSGSGN